ncbi:MAG TPA: BON domain-containing protein [Pantanalinema sp.]
MRGSRGTRGKEDVANALREAFAKDPLIKAERIRITMLAPGALALQGEVSTLAEKDEAGFIARQIAPQCEIDNSLTVAVNRPMGDAALARRAEEALLAANLPRTVGVQVQDGLAVLRGSVESKELLRKARLAVSHVPGIKDVREELLSLEGRQVFETLGAARTGRTDLEAPGEDLELVDAIPAPDVVNRIEELLANRMDPARADEIRVTFDQGIARLTGFVKTIEELARAEKLARSVSGVRAVRNHLVSLDGSAGCDEALATEIRRGLGAKGDHASPVDIKAYVAEDTAYLQGVVDFPEQIAQAVAIARGVQGIAHVHHSLQVSERHFRSGAGPGHAASDAREQLADKGLDWDPNRPES